MATLTKRTTTDDSSTTTKHQLRYTTATLSRLQSLRLFRSLLRLRLENFVEQKRFEQVAFSFVELAVELDPEMYRKHRVTVVRFYTDSNTY